MNKTREAPIVFRRSWITLVPTWGLVVSLLLILFQPAMQPCLQNPGFVVATLVLPLAWAVSQTLRWLSRTWTVMDEGRLLVQEGVVFSHGQLIHLCSVQEPNVHPVGGWLTMGHIAFTAIDHTGERRDFQWAWMGHLTSWQKLLEIRGPLPNRERPKHKASHLIPET